MNIKKIANNALQFTINRLIEILAVGILEKRRGLKSTKNWW
tara:strand:+ start:430 stop:552 length:123 start_codon:yes stop_codon:yes gene_type:complete